jgi:hypothetical protein
MKRRFATVCLCLIGAFLTSATQAEQFQITIQNISPNVLSPAFFGTHDGTWNLFDEGAAASAAVEAVAESGNTAPMVADAMAAPGVLGYGVAGAAPLMTGQSATTTLMADMAHPWLSFASMMGVSNDGFIGAAIADGAIDLFPGGMPFNGVIVLTHLDVWDAGTEVNDESAMSVGALGGMGGIDENGLITKPHPGILGIGDIPLSYNWFPGDVAMITITPEPTSVALLAVAVLVLRRRRF